MPAVDRNLLTAQLDDALDREGCPVCYLGRTAEYRYMDILLYECINDLGVRRTLQRSHGLCTFHTYRLLEVGGYGIHAKLAILYRDLVNTMAQEVRQAPTRRPGKLEMERDCPVCTALRQSENDYVELLPGYLRDDARRERYGHSHGLCMRHWGQVYEHADPTLRSFLRDDQALRLDALAADLGEFVRKSVVQSEPFGQERDVWIRALRTYAGALKLEDFPEPGRGSSAPSDETQEVDA